MLRVEKLNKTMVRVKTVGDDKYIYIDQNEADLIPSLTRQALEDGVDMEVGTMRITRKRTSPYFILDFSKTLGEGHKTNSLYLTEYEIIGLADAVKLYNKRIA